MDYVDPASGAVYYLHLASGESSWELPPDFVADAADDTDTFDFPAEGRGGGPAYSYDQGGGGGEDGYGYGSEGYGGGYFDEAGNWVDGVDDAPGHLARQAAAAGSRSAGVEDRFSPPPPPLGPPGHGVGTSEGMDEEKEEGESLGGGHAMDTAASGAAAPPAAPPAHARPSPGVGALAAPTPGLAPVPATPGGGAGDGGGKRSSGAEAEVRPNRRAVRPARPARLCSLAAGWPSSAH